MQEIRIDETKPKHTKALVSIAVVVLCIIFLSGYLQVSGIFLKSPTQKTSKDLPVATNPIFTKVLSITVDKEDLVDDTAPEVVRSFLGKWQGEWIFSNGVRIPAVFVVSGIVPGKGVSVSYVSSGNETLGISAIDGTVIGNVVLSPKDKETIVLEIPIPQIMDESPIPLYFKFLNKTSLEGSFMHPQKKEVVRGIFSIIEE